ncbi:MAG: prephenate dehydrogenase/arogenate dehydrogenase family protein [Planctomycetaceae bacterium]|nr:prephenate dehydrogenase/arogenate dehydrogenase family protein [Planctomycetaceae bacterium]
MAIFSRIVIIGVGLIGGSVGLAARRGNIADSVIGIDCRQDHLDIALQRGAVDYASTDFQTGILHLGYSSRRSARISTEARLRPELIVAAVPVSKIAACLKDAAAVLDRFDDPRDFLLTDVGSTKSMICSQFRDSRFIGSHPIAGSEKIGPAFSDENLFKNRIAVVTPSSHNKEVNVGLLVRFWQKLCSRVVCLSPEEHDTHLAKTSHLPHLVSSLLAETLEMRDKRYAGTGFRSTTRLASGGPLMWRDVVCSNQAAVLNAVKGFEEILKTMRQQIEQSDWDGLTQTLESAKIKRDGLED